MSKQSTFIPEWKRKNNAEKAMWVFLVGYSLFQSIVLILVFINHLMSPDIYRGLMVQVVGRALSGLPVYPPPTAEYIGMVYNPLLLALGVVFSSVFGEGASVLHFVVILGALCSWILIFIIVRKETNSSLMGLVAFGLFASAYLSFDGYIDGGADSWLLACSLFGIYLLDKYQTPKGWFFGVLVLSMSFWFKQHGAIIAVAGLAYLTFLIRQRAIPYWFLAFLLVPVSYLLIGPLLFGEKYIYYTYMVPRAWSEFNYYTVDRIAKYFVKHWAVLSIMTVLGVWNVVRYKARLNVWEFTLPFALLAGLLGSLDPGSENNQYIIPSVWLIICGSIILYRHYNSVGNHTAKLWGLAISRPVFLQVLILLAFLQNYYYIPDAFYPKEAWEDYNDLVVYIDRLDGDVYIPSIGQLPSGVRLKYTASWVQLEDLVRGPGKQTYNHPLVRSILAEIIEPQGNVYIITESPLEQDPLLGFLSEYYFLVDDFDDKYKSLKGVPGRFERRWLRYVYAHK